MKFRVEHVFENITLPQYEELYFDEPFNEELCEKVNLSRTLEKLDRSDGHLTRVVRVGPDREIPRPVAKVLGNNRIEYTEHVEYDFGSYKGTWKTVSSLMTDKVDSKGTFSFSEVPGGVKRVIEGEIKVSIFGVGGAVEKFIVNDVEKSYENAARFTQEWIDAGKVG